MTLVDKSGLTVTAQGGREIVVTRVFRAPRQLVFDAWTRPELVQRWFGRRDWTLPVCEIDLCPGGAYYYVMRGPDGAEVAMRGEYLEVAPPERLVSTERFEGFSEVGWRPEDETQGTLVLTEQGGLTTVQLTTRYYSQEIRDAALNLSPAWTGFGESLERLEDVVREVRA